MTLVDEPEDVEGDGGGRGRVEDHRRRRRGRDRRRDAHLNLGFVLRACTTRGGEEVFQPTLLFIQLFSISVSYCFEQRCVKMFSVSASIQPKFG